MASITVRLSSSGMAEMLRSSEVQSACMDVAEERAEVARSRGVYVEGQPGDIPLPITVVDSKGSRARALILIDHPSGMAVEAKHRLLGGSV